MAKAPTNTNGVDLDSDAPIGGDTALIGDASGDGHIITDGGDEEEGSWDLPEDKKGTRKPDTSAEKDDDAGFDEEDARLAYSDDDDFPQETAEQRGKRARRNASKRRAREAANSEIMALRTALAEQGKVIKSLVSGQSSLAVNTIAGQISQLEGSIRIADEEMATAIKNSDGDTFAKAQNIRDQIVGRLSVLRSQKERMDSMATNQEEDDGTQQGQQFRQPAVDPRIARTVETYFDRFCDRYPWFDAESTDPDSNIVRAVDAHLVNQGYQRHTPVFWQEMERTLSTRYKLMPNKGDSNDDDAADDLPPPRRQEQRGSAMMSRGGQRPPTNAGRGASNGRGGFHLDATQTSMLRDEGLLGDNLSKEDIAKRDRIVNRWKSGFESLRKQGAR